jgi:hypothetical protein
MSSDPIMLRNVRLSFPALWTPRAFEEGQPQKFEASFLLDPSDATHNQLLHELNARATAMLQAEYNGTVPPGFKFCWGDGNEVAHKRPEYAGLWFVRSNNKTRPLVIDANRTPLAEADGRPYAGCYVNAQISLWIQDNKWGRRIGANLLGVQFVSDGEPFSGAMVASQDDFDVIEGPAGGDFPVAPGAPAAPAPAAPAAPAPAAPAPAAPAAPAPAAPAAPAPAAPAAPVPPGPPQG